MVIKIGGIALGKQEVQALVRVNSCPSVAKKRCVYILGFQ